MKYQEYCEDEFTVIVNSPGRINIIGEHTDYNNGYVLPTAINKQIQFLLKENNLTSTCNVYSESIDESFQFDLNKVVQSSDLWKNYLLGVINEIQILGKELKGFDCVFKSNLPIGSGVSSSAALECGFASGLNELFNLELTKLELVKLSQRAEHNFVGTKCGIMDQFASVMSQSQKVILLDCNTLDYQYVPFQLKSHKILLLNSNVSHNLASSEYNRRRQECENSVSKISKKYKNVSSLRNVTLAMLNNCKDILTEIEFDRSEYVIEENERVLNAVQCLENNDLEKLGELMYETHEGLKEKYEVSCDELDFLVEFSKKNKGVLGARMMGGGFGGCTINLIDEKEIDNFVKEISEEYLKKFNIKLTSFEALPSQGTSIERVK